MSEGKVCLLFTSAQLRGALYPVSLHSPEVRPFFSRPAANSAAVFSDLGASLVDNTSVLIEEIIDAHGGRDLWTRTQRLDAELSVRGFLFAVKQRQVLDHARVQAFCHQPSFLFIGYPGPGMIGEFSGGAEVRILDADNRIVKQRTQPRAAFRHLRRMLWWDDLDFLYFGGYATWNYLVTPFIFMRSGFSFEYLGQRRISKEKFTCLRVSFPPDIPTHCRTQMFYFDQDMLLRRLDYTAEVVGRWAHAAHFCDDYRDFSGLKVPARRRVMPLVFGQVLSMPTLVALDIHDVQTRPDSPV